MSSSNSPRMYAYVARVLHLDGTIVQHLVRGSAASACATRLIPKLPNTAIRVSIGMLGLGGTFQSLFSKDLA